MPSKCPSGQTYNRTLKSCRDKKKPGRKAGTKKRRCPVHQTYNRSLKACRDKKKPGKKVMASAANNTITFTFAANLIGGPAYSEDVSAKLLAWYQGFAEDFADEYPGMKIKHLGGNVFEGTYKPKFFDVDYLESFVDPDEDGNHPIKVGRRSYIVMGNLLTVNGQPHKND